MLVVTKNVLELHLMCIRSELPLCQFPGNGASYMSLLGWQVTKRKRNKSGLLQVPNKICGSYEKSLVPKARGDCLFFLVLRRWQRSFEKLVKILNFNSRLNTSWKTCMLL